GLAVPTCSRRTYAVLAPISRGCPPLQDTFRCITHPFATLLRVAPFRVRLACVRHAASVQSEPGSNSSVQSIFFNRYAIAANGEVFTTPFAAHSKSLQG